MFGQSDDEATSAAHRVLRYGTEEPPPARRELRAGPLSAVLENGDLRYVTLGDEEIVRRVYVAVRDRNWGTIEPRFTSTQFQSNDRGFAVAFTAEHVAGDVDFVWEGRIEGTSAGVISCRMEGVARRAFFRNRIGFCVLHPMDLAGTPVEVETPDGTTAGSFPDPISPHQPFFDMVAIRHPTRDGGELEIRFAGDLFEMEDQRNWTDASYKTYCTPLRLPYPVEIAAGERVVQSVTLSVRTGTAIATEAAGDGQLRVEVGSDPVGGLPPIGLGVASHGQPLAEAEIARLWALKPAHLRVGLDLDDAAWPGKLRQAVAQARALGAGLELEVIAGDEGEGLEDLVDLLKTEGAPLARLLVFPRSGLVSTEPGLRRARELATAAELAVPIGGGSRAYFTQLNRATLPLAAMDTVGYAINPQVHAFDNASLVETLAGQAATVESARAIGGDRPLAIGPVTLRPRFNPDATGPEPRTAPGELPPTVDPRQPSLFAAGWTVGSIHRLATAGASSLTYYETTGWRGLIERSDHELRVATFHSRPGLVFPLYHVLADVGEFAGAELLPIEVSDPLAVEALALRSGERVRVLVASLVDAPRNVSLGLPAGVGWSVRLLDETTAERAGSDPAAFRRDGRSLPVGEGLQLELLPFAVATLDAEGAGA